MPLELVLLNKAFFKPEFISFSKSSYSNQRKKEKHFSKEHVK